ncbi:MAG: DUF1080 domain-containing protein [Bacteroidales bacterium]
MNKKNVCFLYVFVIFAISSCSLGDKKLFNGKNLDAWEVFVGKHVYNKDANASTLNIFSIVKEDGAPAIRISGEANASLCTKDSYSDFHLHLEFKYGDKVYDKRNSGLLYHSFGDFGVGIDTWKSSIEFQMMEGNMGAMYCMGNITSSVNSVSTDAETFTYDPNGDAIKFGAGSDNGKYCKAISGYEETSGEWNTIDLYCLDNKAVHVLNGKVVCVLSNISTTNKEDNSLQHGQIQLQSEGAELFIRKISIEDIDEITINY